MRRRSVAVVLGIAALVGASLSVPTTAGAQGASGKKAVLLGSIQGTNVPSVNTQNRAGLKAGVLAAKRAGVNVKIDVCDDETDPNSGAKCARQFADDPNVVALVGTNSNNGPTVDPVLEEAKLPAIGQSLFSLDDFKSTMMFPADGGSISGIAVAGPVCFNDLKGKSISLAYIDIAAGAQLLPVFNSFVLKPFGKELTTSVPIPVTAADLSSQAAKLVSDGADCLVIATGQESATQLVQALKQQGYKGHIFISGNVHSQASLLKQLGKDTSEGLVLIVSYDYASKLAKQFVKDMKTVSGKKASELISDQSLKAWYSVKIAADTLKKLNPRDRAAMLAALEKTTYDTQGLLEGPLDYTKRVSNPAVFGGAAPNLILPFAIGAEMKNGKLKPTGDWLDAFGGPK